MMPRRWTVATIALLLLGLSRWTTAQGHKLLRIDSPRDGTVVHPGDKITFAVSSPSGAVVGPVFVLGEGYIVGYPPARVPAQIPVSIPATLRPGKYTISAVAKTASGEEAADTITLDVEMPDSPAHEAGQPGTSILEKLRAEPSRLILQTQGEQYPIHLIVTYTNGQDVDVSESSRLVLRSSNPNIAKVGSEGMITAVNRGDTAITAIYVEGGRSVHVTVPVTVEAEIVTVAPSTVDFGGVPVGKSVQQQVSVTYNNTENPTLGIVDIKISGDFSQTNNCPPISATRKETTCTVTVTFTPGQLGTRRGELSLRDNWTVAPTRIPLIGRAIPR